MNKENKTILYRVGNETSEYPLDLNLCNAVDGSLNDFYIIENGAERKITLSDVVEGQISKVKENAGSGYNAQNAGSGNCAKNASSGYNAKNASSGDNAQNASSGYNAKNASSGYNAKNASSGDCAQNTSSGDNAQNASSGNYAQNVSSGNYAQNVSSGNYAKNASSGNYAQNASSGDNAQNASSGYNAKNASSGYKTHHVTTGINSIDFACGRLSTIQSKKGNWISLAEYEQVGNIWKPCFALSAQVGNEDYRDGNGDVLSEDEEYMLYNRCFQKVIRADGILLIKTKRRVVGGIEIWNVTEPYNENGDIKYLIYDGENYSHGKTLREAKESLIYKISDRDTSSYEVWKENPDYIIKKDEAIKGYRAITGACERGVRHFVDNMETVPQELTVPELINLTDGQYGNDKLRKFVNLELKSCL